MQTQWPGAFLGGERFGNRIDGFDLGNSPLEYCRADLARIVTTTTNGTVALRACAHAKLTLVGALLNMAALAEYLRRSPADRLLLVCAGTFRELALEDVFAAGMLAAEFPDAVLSDAAQTALAVYLQSGGDVSTLLNRAKNGRRLTADGRADDVAFCGQLSRFSAVGIMRDGAIRST